METVITSSYEETQKLGEEFAKNLKNGGIVCLYGDLGSGKTTFVQGLAKGLGIEKRLISPTFIIVRTYQVPVYSSSEHSESRSSMRHSGDPAMEGDSRIKKGRSWTSQDDDYTQARTIRNFYHIDLYRVQSEKDLKGLGLKEILEEQGSIVAIEWAEKLGSLLPEKRWDLRFDHDLENKRQITINTIMGND